MAKTVAFHLQKGGVGKTTISGTLACESALTGHKTLIVDCDPQGNISSWFLKDPPKYELADVLQGKCFINDAIIKVPSVDNLYILPTFGIGGTLKLYSETKLSEEPYVLQDLIGELSSDFERIILDLSPGLGRLERSALIASDEVVSPMISEVFSLDGLEIFIHELQKIKKNMRVAVKHNKVIILFKLCIQIVHIFNLLAGRACYFVLRIIFSDIILQQRRYNYNFIKTISCPFKTIIAVLI